MVSCCAFLDSADLATSLPFPHHQGFRVLGAARAPHGARDASFTFTLARMLPTARLDALGFGLLQHTRASRPQHL